MGVRALRKIQLGDESVKGTAVAASAIWRGLGVMTDNRETVFVDEDVGYLSGTDRTYVPKLEAAISFEEVPATFEQLPYILEAGIESETPTQDGAGSDYIYVYNFPTTAARTIRTYTIEAGDNTQAEEFAYGFVRSFTIAGAGGEAVTMQADWVGRQVASSTFTGALSLPTVEEILYGNTKLYIDATSTYPATTQVTGTLHSFSLNVNDTGHQPKYLGDGNLYFTTDFQAMPDVTLDLVFNYIAGAYTEKNTNWRGEVARSIRILVEGSTVGTPGTTYSKKSLIIDLAGKWESFSEMQDIDGNNTVVGTFRARYEGTAAAMGKITVVNELAALV